METELKVRAESLPERCEICHQDDRFDPQTNHCSRCAGVPTTVPSSYSNRASYINAVNRARRVKTMGALTLAIMVANILFLGGINSITIISLLLGVETLVEGRQIQNILRSENSSDPDWTVTRDRANAGVIYSAAGTLLGILGLVLWYFIL
jgi:hypothetical protein